jgi:hypothetical protein
MCCGTDGRVAVSGHGDPEQLEGERSRGRAGDRVRLGTQTSVDSLRSRRVRDWLRLRHEGGRGADGDRGLGGLVGDSDLLVVVAEDGGSGSRSLLAVEDASAGSGSLVVHVLVGGSLEVEVILVDEDTGSEHFWVGVSKLEHCEFMERMSAYF